MNLKILEDMTVDEVMTEDQKVMAADAFADAMGIEFKVAVEILPALWKKAIPSKDYKVGYPDKDFLMLTEPEAMMKRLNEIEPLALYATLNMLGAIPSSIHDWNGILGGKRRA